MTPFVEAYVMCALWSSVDEEGLPLDDQFDIEDIAPESLIEMTRDCEAFQESEGADLERAGEDSQNGQDFWLTRNGHGAGFWDRGYGEVGRRLTEAAHVWGSSNLYIGYDGKLHIS